MATPSRRETVDNSVVSDTSAALPPALATRVHHRQDITQRLTVFYVASLSAIAGLSIAGQLLIQRALSHQALDGDVIHVTLEHKEKVGRAIHGLRSLRRIKVETDREAAVQEVEASLTQMETTWQQIKQLSPETLASSNHRQHHTEGMVKRLEPTYDDAWKQLNGALEKARNLDVDAPLVRSRGEQPHQGRASRVRAGEQHPPTQRKPPRGQSPSTQGRLAPRPVPPLNALEERYMSEIDEALEAYNQSITDNVQQLKQLELFLLAVTLLVLLLEGVMIFRPAVMQTRDALSALAASLDETQQTAAKLASEQKKSEKLLLNILPQSIAQRLKQRHQPIADAFEDVTVLFADIVGFTQLSTQMPPQELVKMLNQIFSAFDARVEQLGLEKIKTIGDAYMVVGGLPKPRADHAEAIVTLAQQMQAEIEQFNQRTGCSLSMRIGINSGPVVAGVIGTKKFIYDLWGDTVNVASRMESHGQPGRIHLSASTQRLIGDRYPTQARGTIQVKGKGQTATYWLAESSPVPAAMA